MFYPCLPGRYDASAVLFSFIVHVFVIGGLLYAPLSVAWGIRILLNPQRKSSFFIYATLLLTAFIIAFTGLGIISSHNTVLGISFLLLSFSFLVYFFRKFRTEIQAETKEFDFVPFYLLLIPVFLVIIRLLFFSNAVEHSRNYAIKNSELLIQAIESFHQREGHYPLSLQALHADYKPGIVGIDQYHYEPFGKAYNLYFKNFSDDLAAEEIVMYNKLDEHAFAAHATDILEYSGATLALRRGDRDQHQLTQEHWVYFRFD